MKTLLQREFMGICLRKVIFVFLIGLFGVNFFVSSVAFAEDEVSFKKLSVGIGADYGLIATLDYDAIVSSDYWELNLLGGYYLSEKKALRVGMGFERIAENQSGNSEYKFNGEVGFEFHVAAPQKKAGMYLFFAGGYPDYFQLGFGLRMGKVKKVSGFLELHSSVRTSASVSLSGRAGVRFHF